MAKNTLQMMSWSVIALNPFKILLNNTTSYIPCHGQVLKNTENQRQPIAFPPQCSTQSKNQTYLKKLRGGKLSLGIGFCSFSFLISPL